MIVKLTKQHRTDTVLAKKKYYYHDAVMQKINKKITTRLKKNKTLKTERGDLYRILKKTRDM